MKYVLGFRKITIFISVILSLSVCGQTSQLTRDQIRFHDITNDTTRITDILTKVLANNPGTPGERVEMIGRMFLETPYVGHTLEVDSGMPEVLTVNIDELDCTTFVETVAALAMTVGQKRSSWRDFVNNLESIRYRNGSMDGYASRLHYIANWIIDNSFRGNIKDVAPLFPKVNYTTKTINFMTANRDKYTALSDSTEYARILKVEEGYKNHRFPYIKTLDLTNKETKKAFRTGDIVALTSNLKNLDVTHMGIVVLVDDEPYLMHASSSHRKVEISSVPLSEFMRRNRTLTGLRVFRLQE